MGYPGQALQHTHLRIIVGLVAVTVAGGADIDVDPDFKFLEDDLVLFIGHRDNINNFFESI